MPHVLEPIPAKQFKKFIEYILCEARASRGPLLVYWRGDLRQPVTFKADGLVPVTHIQTCLRILGMTIQQYLSILDHLFPND
ncbi:MAG: hypothetical protein HY597_00805 [Candidatus Omnitrophica bacterium]|nr:hypothetical protein [Candidatus Omnitrophota bacterium]